METTPQQMSEAMVDKTSDGPSMETAGWDAEVRLLRMGVLALGAGLLLLSICFNLFVYKQNNLLVAQVDAQSRLLSQSEPVFEANRQKLTLMAQDLRAFAQVHSDVIPILVNHNLVKPALAPNPILSLPVSR